MKKPSSVERVALAMACTEYPPETLGAVDAYKNDLNVNGTEWGRLYAEIDPLVLSALLWDWIDQLQVSLRKYYQISNANYQ